MTRAFAAETSDMMKILGLEGRYGPLWDSGNSVGWADLFTDAGIFELGVDGSSPPVIFTGKAELKQFCDDITVAYRGLHILGIPDIVMGQGTASARVHFHWVGFGQKGPDQLIQRQTFGFYEVSYEQTEAGWRMARRVEKPTSTIISETFGMSLPGSPNRS